jgi:hypothetical protein
MVVEEENLPGYNNSLLEEGVNIPEYQLGSAISTPPIANL